MDFANIVPITAAGIDNSNDLLMLYNQSSPLEPKLLRLSEDVHSVLGDKGTLTHAEIEEELETLSSFDTDLQGTISNHVSDEDVHLTIEKLALWQTKFVRLVGASYETSTKTLSWTSLVIHVPFANMSFSVTSPAVFSTTQQAACIDLTGATTQDPLILSKQDFTTSLLYIFPFAYLTANAGLYILPDNHI